MALWRRMEPPRLPLSHTAAELEIGSVPKTVILYSATGCPLCARYRALFDEQGYPFEERNTTEEPAYLDELAGFGIMATPAVVAGDRAIPGYRPNSSSQIRPLRAAGRGAIVHQPASSPLVQALIGKSA